MPCAVNVRLLAVAQQELDEAVSHCDSQSRYSPVWCAILASPGPSSTLGASVWRVRLRSR